MHITRADLLRLCPNATAGILDGLERYAPDMLPRYGITTNLRLCHLLAQLAHESGGLRATVENLNYSAAGLRATFPRYFTAAQAEDYARQPQRIASRAYANRMGNGDEASGDGWRYRGRGLIQLTGRENYRKTGMTLGLDLEGTPEDAAEFPVALETALVYWTDRRLSQYADDDDAEMITRAINGGTNGMADRLRLLALAKTIWPPGVAWVPPHRPPVEPDIPDDPPTPEPTQPAAPAAGFFMRMLRRIFG
jgi:putative chitinase